MGRIPDNFIPVPKNKPTNIPLDIDAMVRKSNIFIFDIKNERKNDIIDPYDDYYLKLYTERGIVISTDEAGFPNIIEGVIYNICATINFLAAQFIAAMKPIEKALKLASVLSNPTKLAKLVKEIIELVKGLIESIMKFLTKTGDWIKENILEPLSKIKTPFPEFKLNIFGIELIIPGYKSEFFTKILEKLGDKIKALVAEMTELYQKITDAINQSTLVAKMIAMKNALLNALREQIKKLKESLTIFDSDLQRAIRIRDEILGKNITDFNTDNNIYIDIKWDEMKTDIVKIITELQKEKKDEDDDLKSIDSIKDKEDWDKQKLVTDKTTSDYNQWVKYQTDNISYEGVLYETKLKRLNEIRQYIVEYYQNKKSFIQKLIDAYNEDIAKLEKEIAELLIKLKNAINLDEILKKLYEKLKQVIKNLIEANPVGIFGMTIIEVLKNIIIFPIKLIIGIIEAFIDAIMGLLENIPNLSKMVEGFMKLVEKIKNLPLVKGIQELIIDICDTIVSGAKKVFEWMMKNGGILKENLDKALAWIKTNIVDNLEILLNFFPIILNIVLFLPELCIIIIQGYIDYAFKDVPSPVKSLIGI